MKADVVTMEATSAGSVELADEVYALEPRKDILHRMVRYQLAKRQAGTHASKDRSQVSGTGTKMFKQKGTGRARHSTRKVNLFRGGGKAFGPKPRSHAIGLPKKMRALALRHALSAKAQAKELVVLDKAELAAPKTSAMRQSLAKLGLQNALIVDGPQLEKNFVLAARNLPNIDVLPVQGINVYDILRRRKLVLTRAAVDSLADRFAGKGTGDRK